MAKIVLRSRAKGYNKFGALPTKEYASRREARRAEELHALERAGEISGLREQVSYVLVPPQYGECGTDFKGRRVKVLLERGVRYVADFVYRDSMGNIVVEDAKGVRTREYVIKRKLMLWVHGIRIKEV